MHLLASLLTAVAVAAASSTLAAEPPTLWRGDAAGTGQQRAGSAPWIASVRFAVDLGSPVRGSPVVRAGTLFVGASDGTFSALDAATGTRRWQVHADGAIASSAAVDDVAVYLAARDGLLRALDVRTGRERWRHRFGAPLGRDDYWDYALSSPVLDAGTLYIGSGDGHVLAFDAMRGTPKWQADAGARVRASPTLVGDLVAVGGRDGQFYALDLATGQLRWRLTHDGASWMLGTATDGRTLYIGGGSAALVQAVDAATGAERWRHKTRSAVFTSPVLAGDTLLAGDFSGVLYALDRASGRLQWEFPLGGRVLATPTVAGKVVYAASDAGVLYALDTTPAPLPAAVPRRIVYREGPRSPQAFSWFLNGIDAALAAQLKAAGYDSLDADALRAFLLEQTPASPPAVVVFADNRFPAAIVDTSSGIAPIRRFLDAGGKVALLGPNPLAYQADGATGELQDIDFDRPQALFDVRYPPPQEAGGFYAVAPTPEGRAMGLRHAGVASSPVDVQPGITVLSKDEFGRASAWLRGYGGRAGTGLLQLQLSRLDPPDLAELRALVEYGVTW